MTGHLHKQVDPSLIRFGQFAFEIELTCPNNAQRADTIKLATQGLQIDPDEINKVLLKARVEHR